MSEKYKAETCRFIERVFNQGNPDVLDEIVPPEGVHHDRTSPDEERSPEDTLRQRREISEPPKGNAKTPKAIRGPTGERVRRLAGARDLHYLFKVRTRCRIFELLAIGADGNIAVGEMALVESENFGETPTHLSRIEAEFVDEMRDALELHPTELSKFELGLCAAGLNPSGGSILDLKQRTECYNEKARA